MAQTLATAKQAEAIKQRMREIRSELPYDVDRARERVRQISDWKYHFRRHPLPVISLAAAVGYLLVPGKQSTTSTAQVHLGAPEADAPSKKSLLGGIAGAVATVALKQATTLAAHRVGEFLGHRGRTSAMTASPVTQSVAPLGNRQAKEPI